MFTVLFTIGTFQGAFANLTVTTYGPGTSTDYWYNGTCDWNGAPKPGNHVKTTGAPGNYTQTIVKDQDAKIALINMDPANGVSGNYVPKDVHGQSNVYTVPDQFNGKDTYAPGYPEKEPYNITTVLKEHNNKLSNGKTFTDLFTDNDYVAMVVGASSWCQDCKNFMPDFNKYYTAKHEGKFEAVYFSKDGSQTDYDEATKDYPMPKADFMERGQINAVLSYFKDNLKVTSIPAVVVVAKNGDVKTTHGVAALRGEQLPSEELPHGRDGAVTPSFPLPAPEHYFKKADSTQDCPVDEQEQVRQLKEAVKERVGLLSDLQLKYYAKEVTDSGDKDVTDDMTDEQVRAYVEGRFNSFIDEAEKDDGQVNHSSKLVELYKKLSEERTDVKKQRFEEHDRIRVLRAFESDQYQGAQGQDVPATTNAGVENTGEILKVQQDKDGIFTDAIWVKFDDDEYARRWLLPNSYQYIENEGLQRSHSAPF